MVSGPTTALEKGFDHFLTQSPQTAPKTILDTQKKHYPGDERRRGVDRDSLYKSKKLMEIPVPPPKLEGARHVPPPTPAPDKPQGLKRNENPHPSSLLPPRPMGLSRVPGAARPYGPSTTVESLWADGGKRIDAANPTRLEHPEAWPGWKGHPPDYNRQGKLIDYTWRGAAECGVFQRRKVHRNEPVEAPFPIERLKPRRGLVEVPGHPLGGIERIGPAPEIGPAGTNDPAAPAAAATAPGRMAGRRGAGRRTEAQRAAAPPLQAVTAATARRRRAAAAVRPERSGRGRTAVRRHPHCDFVCAGSRAAAAPLWTTPSWDKTVKGRDPPGPLYPPVGPKDGKLNVILPPNPFTHTGLYRP
eukprot:tig00020614_g12161.t1